VTPREPNLVTPFWVRFASETSLSPGWLLIAFPAVLYPFYLTLEALFGRGLAAAMDFAGDYEARILPLYATLLGCLSMMGVYVARGTFRDLEALRPLLRGGQTTYSELRQQLKWFDRRRLWIGGLFGAAFFCVVAEVALGRLTSLLAGESFLRATCMVAAGSALWIMIGLGAVYVIDSARLYSSTGERHVAIDLLDLGPLLPLTRHGLRIVLLLVVMMAGHMVMLTATTGFSSELGPMTRIVGVAFWIVPVAAAAFLLPVRGLRRQIRARKAEELTRVREEIHRNRELAAESGTEAAEAGAKLPGLLAYKHEIESVREWPFDAPTLTRFFLYVAIPLGSWVGGALVERLLGVALD